MEVSKELDLSDFARTAHKHQRLESEIKAWGRCAIHLTQMKPHSLSESKNNIRRIFIRLVPGFLCLMESSPALITSSLKILGLEVVLMVLQRQAITASQGGHIDGTI